MQRREKLDFNRLKKMMIQGQKQLKNCKQQSIVVIGKTGSGKSCLVNLLIGNNLNFVHKSRTQLQFRLENESKGPAIGNSMSSQTTIPKYWKSTDDQFYWDCPGFNDNKSPQQDICNSLLILKLFDWLKQIKILIVFCSKDFDLDRGAGLIELIKNICRLFIDVNQALPMLQIAITKCPQDFQKIEIQKKLSLILQQVEQIQEPHKQIIKTLKTNYQKYFSIFYKPAGKIEQLGTINENQILDVKKLLKEINYWPTPKIKPLIKQSNINLIYELIDVFRNNYSMILKKILQQFSKRLINIRSQKVRKTFFEQQDKIKKQFQKLFYSKYIFQRQLKQNHNFKSFNQLFGDFLDGLFTNQKSQNKKQLEDCLEGLIYFSRFIKNSQQILDIGLNFVSSIYKVSSEKFLQLLKLTQDQGNALIDEIEKQIFQSLQNAKNFNKDLLIKGNKQIQKLKQYLFKQEGEKIIYTIIEFLENQFDIQIHLPQKFQIHNQRIKKFLQYGYQTVKFQKLKLLNCLWRIQKFVNNKIGQFQTQQLLEKIKETQIQSQKRNQQLQNKMKQSQRKKQIEKFKAYVLKNVQQKEYKVIFQNKPKNKLIISKHDIEFSEIQQKIMSQYKKEAINDMKDLKDRIQQQGVCKSIISQQKNPQTLPHLQNYKKFYNQNNTYPNPRQQPIKIPVRIESHLKPRTISIYGSSIILLEIFDLIRKHKQKIDNQSCQQVHNKKYYILKIYSNESIKLDQSIRWNNLTIILIAPLIKVTQQINFEIKGQNGKQGTSPKQFNLSEKIFKSLNKNSKKQQLQGYSGEKGYPGGNLIIFTANFINGQKLSVDVSGGDGGNGGKGLDGYFQKINTMIYKNIIKGY